MAKKRISIELLLDDGTITHYPDIFLNQIQSHLGDSGISVFDVANNSKALERYIGTIFTRHDGSKFETYVPYNSVKYYGLSNMLPSDIASYLIYIKPFFEQEAIDNWVENERIKWASSSSDVTKDIFLKLLSFQPEYDFRDENNNNSDNPSRRIQDLKQRGYSIASIPNRIVFENGQPVMRGGKKYKKCMRYLLPLQTYDTHLHEIMSPQFAARVKRVLGYVEAYENKEICHEFLIPDHKFPEVRWEAGKVDDNPDNMSEELIKEKFQLLDNHRNLEKREICRNCLETGRRGVIFGIPFYYSGSEQWDSSIPSLGKDAKYGCIGCPWYDIQEWRKHLLKSIKK